MNDPNVWLLRYGKLLVLCAATCALPACSTKTKLVPPVVPLTEPGHLCSDDGERGRCRPAEKLVQWMRDPGLQVLQATDPPSGTQGAKVLTLAVEPDGGERVVFRAKWRALESGGLFNEPRKEVGAFAVQQLFLSPAEYVVPPTTTHCFDLATYRRIIDAAAQPSFERIPCVFGVLSYWLPNVRDLDDAEKAGVLRDDTLVDRDLFDRNPTYRRSVANLNVLTYLIRHGDAHNGQFLVETGPGGPRPYVVDNSLAFEAVQNPMLLFREDWSTIRVRALPERTVQRLRALTKADLGKLAAIEQATVEDEVLVISRSGAPVGNYDEGLRWIGNVLQIGLTRAEIDGVWVRLRALLDDVDGEKIGVF